MANRARQTKQVEDQSAKPAEAGDGDGDGVALALARQNADTQDENSGDGEEQNETSSEELERQVCFQRLLGTVASRFHRPDHIEKFLGNFAYISQGIMGREEREGGPVETHKYCGHFITMNPPVFLGIGKMCNPETGAVRRRDIEPAYEELARINEDCPHFLTEELIPAMVKIESIRLNAPDLDPYVAKIKRFYEDSRDIAEEYNKGKKNDGSPTLKDKWPKDGEATAPKPSIF